MNDYYLASQMASGVKPPSHLAVTSKAAALTNNRLQAVFEVSLPYTTSTLNAVGVIYAAGPLDSTGALQQHTYVIPSSSFCLMFHRAIPPIFNVLTSSNALASEQVTGLIVASLIRLDI